MIEFHDVCKRYATGQEALSHLSFSVEEQEIVFLTGHSGAGKSTVMKLIMLMERPTSGQVMIAGRNLSRLSQGQIPFHRRQVGVVFQNHQLLFDRTVFDNVALPLQICGVHHREVARRVRASLDKVNLLNKENAFPISLSGGEQQRVGIARAVVNKPPLLLADEPTGNLDPELSAEIMELFRQFSEVGVTVMIASHNIELIRSMHRRVLTLDDGKLIHDGVLW
ncbi:MAG: cell division ATP-binding protein FtsE [Marinagarivorans sp.]|nr:cell division ATP-binding protein FtsE [Marinagarivorans sp.]